MYIYKYMYVFILMYIHIYAYVYVCIYIHYMYICIYICICIYSHTHISHPNRTWLNLFQISNSEITATGCFLTPHGYHVRVLDVGQLPFQVCMCRRLESLHLPRTNPKPTYTYLKPTRIPRWPTRSARRDPCACVTPSTSMRPM